MESSSPSGKISEPLAHKWAHLVGITIAMITLTLPLLVIAYYSSYNKADPSVSTPYSLNQTEN